MSLRSFRSFGEKLFFIAVVVVFGFSLASGQETTGKIVGTVTDSTGAVIHRRQANCNQSDVAERTRRDYRR